MDAGGGVRVHGQELERTDGGKHQCGFDSSDLGSPVTLELEVNSCQTPGTQTGYKSSQPAVTCDHPEDSTSSVWVHCKDKGVLCEGFVPTKSPSSSVVLVLSETSTSIAVSISNIRRELEGSYDCQMKSEDAKTRSGLKPIKVTVEGISVFRRSPTAGKPFTYWCSSTSSISNKSICKGEDPLTCEDVVSTTGTRNDRFSVTEDELQKNITVTVSEIKAADAGTYWCRGETSDKTTLYFQRFLMTVASPPTPPGPSPSGSTETLGGSQVQRPAIFAGVLLLQLLLVVLLLAFICRRYSHSKKTATEAQANRQSHLYEEPTECLQSPDSIHTVYATVSHPTNSSDLLHYSTITFSSSADGAREEPPRI
ncbi:uncharacterized protein ACBR49_014006 [Aulostomus maculatus]